LAANNQINDLTGLTTQQVILLWNLLFTNTI